MANRPRRTSRKHVKIDCRRLIFIDMPNGETARLKYSGLRKIDYAHDWLSVKIILAKDSTAQLTKVKVLNGGAA